MIEYGVYLIFLVIALAFTYRTASNKAYSYGFIRGSTVASQRLIGLLIEHDKITEDEVLAFLKLIRNK
jgi:hypothetical protein|tara:strand:+ start:2382 stop:2585 length:204 start_codon:yes stop_codon:yes gene_type:complete